MSSLPCPTRQTFGPACRAGTSILKSPLGPLVVFRLILDRDVACSCVTDGAGWDDIRGMIDQYVDDVVEVELPNGAVALVRPRVVAGDGATKTSVMDRFNFDDVAATIEGVSGAIRAALVSAAPDSVSVELGFELAVKAGKLVGMVVDGEATGSIKVTLGWGRPEGG
jgi:NTP-dependent ternary system trypsin peptidase co-occuring protein